MADGQYEWIILSSIGLFEVDDDQQYVTADELGIGEARSAVETLARLRSSHNSLPMSPLPIEHEDDPFREVGALLGGIAESLSLCRGSLMHAEHLRREVAAGTVQDHLAMSSRFLAEAAVLRAVGAGHQLMNTVVRMVALRHEYKERLQEGIHGYEGTVPAPNGHEEWLSLNKSTAKSLAKATKGFQHKAVVKLGGIPRRLAADAGWKSASEARAADFHRFRAESAVLAGIDGSSSPNSPIRDDHGNKIGESFGGSTNRYTLTEGRDEELIKIGCSALASLATTGLSLADTYSAAIEPLTYGRVALNGKGGFRWQMRRWSDDDCSCCSRSES